MEKIVEQGLLYDFYGELLTKRQREIYEGVVYENLSLGEIAEQLDISRQGVHDTVKRCDKLLADYEEKLGLVARFVAIRREVEHIEELARACADGENTDAKKTCDEIANVAASVIEEL